MALRISEAIMLDLLTNSESGRGVSKSYWDPLKPGDNFIGDKAGGITILGQDFDGGTGGA